MTISTPTKTRESIAFGIGKIYLADSATNITEYNQILTNTAYVGAKTRVSLEAAKEIIEQFSSRRGFKEVVRRIISEVGVTLKCSIIELTAMNMSYAFGGDGSSVNILNDLFAEPAILRAELVFTYPDNATVMNIVLPAAQVVSNPSLSFDSENPIAVGLDISPVATSEAVWASDPLGRVYF